MKKTVIQVTALAGLFLSVHLLVAQDNLQVSRAKAVNFQSRVLSISIDENNTKWVRTDKGLFEVKAPDLGVPATLSPGEQLLYGYPGGNASIRWNTDALQKQLGGVLSATNVVTAAAYDTRRDVLWIGTSESGIYSLKTKPGLQLLNKFNTGNTKLSSNTVNCMYLDPKGQIWIGTDGGVFYGADGKWKVEQKFFTIQSIAYSGNTAWVLSDGILWKVGSDDKWIPANIPEGALEGQPRALAAADDGKLWIASERISCFAPGEETFQTFGPAEYYTSQFPTCLAVDLDGTVWVGTEDKGLYVIEKASAWNVNLIIQQALDCNSNQNTAALEVKVSGGNPPFNFTWNQGFSGANPKNLGPGAYEVTVTDSQGKSKSASVKIADPRVTATASALSPETKDNARDGSAEVKVQGGVAPYTYRWDNGETTPKAMKLGQGAHVVDVLDSKGCKAQAIVDIERRPDALTLVLASKKEVTCANAKDGALTLEAQGGVPPYTYTWSNPAFKGNKAEGLASGSFSVTLTDAEKKQATATFTINQPDPLTAIARVDRSASANGRDGAVSISVTGGTAPYSIQWPDGSAANTLQNLAAGKYTATITDANGCKASATAEVTENILPLDVSITLTAAIKCKGEANAALLVQVQGGKSPYNFQWQPSGLQGERISNLPEGAYNLVVTDAAGNSKNASFTIKAPEALAAQVQATAPAATGQANGRAKAAATGGTAPYSYRWDNGETTIEAVRLAPGKRAVTITDANNCTTTASVDITENILPLSAQITQGYAIKCAGNAEASLEVSVSGGKGPFTFEWNNPAAKGDKPSNLKAGLYQLNVKDASGKSVAATFTIKEPEALSAKVQATAPAATDQSNGKAKVAATGGTAPYIYRWDNGETTVEAVRLAPGQRSVTITDANNCTASASVEITENILPLSAQITQGSTIKCAGNAEASLEVSVSGGKGPFTFEWNNPAAKGDKPSSLKAGIYQLNVKDASGKSVAATFTVKEPEALSAKVQATAPAATDQSNGKAKVAATGGTAPYTYRWDNGETTVEAVRLAPGKRAVTITDANNCATTASVEITENILPISVSVREAKQVSCAGGNDGALSLEITGGKKPYTYRWSQGSSGDLATGLSAGSYQATVTDVLGNTASGSAELKAPAPIQIEWLSLFGAGSQADGQATLKASGGSGQLSIRWDNGESGASAEKLAAGRRQVTVTDERGCTQTSAVEIPRRLIEGLVAGKLNPNQIIQLELVRFEVDSTNFNEASLPMLNELFEFMAKNPRINIEIGGHTSNLCSDAFCDQLSAARAKSVADYLVRRGIEASRVTSKGYGKRFPIATNTTAEGRSKNQRVEIKILETGS